VRQSLPAVIFKR